MCDRPDERIPRRTGAAAATGGDYRWNILASALIVQITISVVTQGLPALAPFAGSDLRLDAAEVGIFATILSVGTMLALLPAGWAVDVFGERRVLIAGGVATGGLTILAAIAPTFVTLVPLLIVVGFAAATSTPAGSTAIMSAFALRDRGFVMSLRQTGIPIGGAVAALLLPPIAATFGWRRALGVAALLAIIGALTGAGIVRKTPLRPKMERRDKRESLRHLTTRDTTYVGLASVFLALGQFVLATYIALYLLDVFGMPLTIGSLFLVAANIGGIVGRMLWGTVSDRLFGGRRKTPLIVVSLCAAAGFEGLAGMPTTTPAVLILLLVVALGATVIGWNGIYITLLSELAPPGRRGRAVAYGMLFTQVGIFSGPFAFGLVVQLSHSYRLAWTMVGGMLLLTAVLLHSVEEGPRREHASPDGTAVPVESSSPSPSSRLTE